MEHLEHMQCGDMFEYVKNIYRYDEICSFEFGDASVGKPQACQQAQSGIRSWGFIPMRGL